QSIIGSASCVLLAAAGCRFFSRRTGALAGLILAVYAPAIFYDGLIQKSVLDLFFLCLLLWLLGESAGPESSTRRRLVLSALSGLAAGCLILTRENAAVFVLVILVWLSTHSAVSGRQRLAAPAMFLLGLALVLSPVAVRNRI